jgi:hypothetical protein
MKNPKRLTAIKRIRTSENYNFEAKSLVGCVSNYYLVSYTIFLPKFNPANKLAKERKTNHFHKFSNFLIFISGVSEKHEKKRKKR